MSTPQINPADLIGIVGGLLNQGQDGNNPFDFGKIVGDLFGDPEQQSKTPPTAQKPAAPSAGRVASDVFTAAGTVGDFLKERFPKKDASSTPVKDELSELLVAMLAEHDGFEGISSGKRESLYRATADKWADKILKQDKPSPKASETAEATPAPATKVTRVTVTAEEETPVAESPITVAVDASELISVEPTDEVKTLRQDAPTDQAIDAVTVNTIASVLHLEKHPDHQEWDICKERNIACKYNTLGEAMAILKQPFA